MSIEYHHLAAGEVASVLELLSTDENLGIVVGPSATDRAPLRPAELP